MMELFKLGSAIVLVPAADSVLLYCFEMFRSFDGRSCTDYCIESVKMSGLDLAAAPAGEESRFCIL